MAVRIIELARRGECDPERLRDRLLREAEATYGRSAPPLSNTTEASLVSWRRQA